jgi:hypothetical protein
MITFLKPSWLGIRNLAKHANDASVDDALLALDSADAETLILRLFKDLDTVKAEECVGSILPSWT